MRNTIEILKYSAPSQIDVLKMEIGQIGKLTEVHCSAQIDDFILRTYSGWVNLNNPNSTWARGQEYSFGMVQILPPGTVLSLAVQS